LKNYIKTTNLKPKRLIDSIWKSSLWNWLPKT